MFRGKPTAIAPVVQIAILTFDGFNELDSFIAASILNRMRPKGWSAHITAPSPMVTSMNGLAVRTQKPLEFAGEADAVVIGSGIRTREIAEDRDIMNRIRLDPARQLIAAQCSGTLIAVRKGLIGDRPACTDLSSRPWVAEAGVEVIDAPFVAHGNVATGGGCLSAVYLAGWIVARGSGIADAAATLHYVAPVGEKWAWTERALDVIRPCLTAPAAVLADLDPAYIRAAFDP